MSEVFWGCSSVVRAASLYLVLASDKRKVVGSNPTSPTIGDVTELVDVADSKSAARKSVGVRLPPSPPSSSK